MQPPLGRFPAAIKAVPDTVPYTFLIPKLFSGELLSHPRQRGVLGLSKMQEVDEISPHLPPRGWHEAHCHPEAASEGQQGRSQALWSSSCCASDTRPMIHLSPVHHSHLLALPFSSISSSGADAHVPQNHDCLPSRYTHSDMSITSLQAPACLSSARCPPQPSDKAWLHVARRQPWAKLPFTLRTDSPLHHYAQRSSRGLPSPRRAHGQLGSANGRQLLLH